MCKRFQYVEQHRRRLQDPQAAVAQVGVALLRLALTGVRRNPLKQGANVDVMEDMIWSAGPGSPTQGPFSGPGWEVVRGRPVRSRDYHVQSRLC